MFPRLTWRSVVILLVGLVAGIGLAMAYRAMSPLSYQINIGWPPLVRQEAVDQAMYESSASIEIIARGATLETTKVLQRQGEYYAIKLLATPFLDWLGWELTQRAPQYAHDSKELAKVIKVKYDYKSQTPALVIETKGASPEEAVFFAGTIPKVFQEYLLAEERNMDLEQYQTNVKEMEEVRASLVEAKRELANLHLLVDPATPNLSPAYITAEARVNALTSRVNSLATTLASVITQEEEYKRSVKEIDMAKSSLIEAKGALAALRLELDAANPSLDPDYVAAEARVNALALKVNGLAASVAALAADREGVESKAKELEAVRASLVDARKEAAGLKLELDTAGPALDPGCVAAEARSNALALKVNQLAVELASLTAQGQTDSDYLNIMADMNRTVDALTQARKELATLKERAEVAMLNKAMEYDEANDRVKALEARYDALAKTARLGTDLGAKEYEETIAEMDRAVDDLAQARKELAALKGQAEIVMLNKTMAYNAAADRAKALETEFEALSKNLNRFDAGAVRYDETLARMGRAVADLAQARTELAILKGQAEVSMLDNTLRYNETSDRVNALESRFDTLSRTVNLWSDQDAKRLEALARLVVGEPTIPILVPPDRIKGRNAVMMGAVAGLGSAWLGLNFKGLARRARSLIASGAVAKKEDNVEEEKEDEED